MSLRPQIGALDGQCAPAHEDVILVQFLMGTRNHLAEVVAASDWRPGRPMCSNGRRKQSFSVTPRMGHRHAESDETYFYVMYRHRHDELERVAMGWGSQCSRCESKTMGLRLRKWQV